MDYATTINNYHNSSSNKFNMIENYLYIYHIGYNQETGQTGQFVILPTYPETITDTLNSSFAETSPLSRSAPIFSYQSSGPRKVSLELKFHRDMMTQINYGKSTLKVELGDDYVDTIIKNLQACALPSYKTALKMIDPPMVAVRFGNEIFIKGIINGGVNVSYSLPLLDNNKYAQVSIQFEITEIDPYDAETISQVGSFRGIDKSIEKRLGIN